LAGAEAFPIFCVAADESKVYIGGSFTAIGGTVRNGLAAFDRGTGQLAAWNPDARDQISSWPTVDRIILSGDTLYVGGSFQALGDTPANNVALISAATGQALAQWSAPSTLGDYELPASTWAGGKAWRCSMQPLARCARMRGSPRTASLSA
jgi:hypothetical protein